MTEHKTARLNNGQPRPSSRMCSRCDKRMTRSLKGVCWACRPVPVVDRNDDERTIFVTGLGRFTERQALALAERISDEIDSLPRKGQNR